MKKPVSPQDEKLIGYITELSDVPPRNPEAAERGKTQFLALADFYRKPVSLPQQSRLNQWIGSRMPIGKIKERKLMLMTITSILTAIVLVLGGGGMTAFAAQESLPSDFLYPLKLQIEDLRLDLNTDPVKEVGLMTAFANRRADEIVQLANEGEEIPAGLVTQLENQLNTMMQMVSELEPDTMEVCLVQIEQHLWDRDRIQSMTGMPDDVDPALMQLQHTLQFHHRLAQDGVEDPLEFQNQFRYQQDGNAGPPDDGTETPTETDMPTDEPTETIVPTDEVDGPPYGPQDGSCEEPGTCGDPIGDQNGQQDHDGEEPPYGDQDGNGQPDDAGVPQGTPQPDNGKGTPQSGNDGGSNSGKGGSSGSGKNK